MSGNGQGEEDKAKEEAEKTAAEIKKLRELGTTGKVAEAYEKKYGKKKPKNDKK